LHSFDHILFLPYDFDAAKNIFVSRHEILATGCIQALLKASTLFGQVAHRVAFCFFLDAPLAVFALDLFALVRTEATAFELALRVEARVATAVRT
jgi:hypothetical protein